jgi:hypothetical protein
LSYIKPPPKDVVQKACAHRACDVLTLFRDAKCAELNCNMLTLSREQFLVVKSDKELYLSTKYKPVDQRQIPGYVSVFLVRNPTPPVVPRQKTDVADYRRTPAFAYR